MAARAHVRVILQSRFLQTRGVPEVKTWTAFVFTLYLDVQIVIWPGAEPVRWLSVQKPFHQIPRVHSEVAKRPLLAEFELAKIPVTQDNSKLPLQFELPPADSFLGLVSVASGKRRPSVEHVIPIERKKYAHD